MTRTAFAIFWYYEEVISYRFYFLVSIFLTTLLPRCVCMWKKRFMRVSRPFRSGLFLRGIPSLVFIIVIFSFRAILGVMETQLVMEGNSLDLKRQQFYLDLYRRKRLIRYNASLFTNYQTENQANKSGRLKIDSQTDISKGYFHGKINFKLDTSAESLSCQHRNTACLVSLLQTLSSLEPKCSDFPTAFQIQSNSF